MRHRAHPSTGRGRLLRKPGRVVSLAGYPPPRFFLNTLSPNILISHGLVISDTSDGPQNILNKGVAGKILWGKELPRRFLVAKEWLENSTRIMSNFS